MNNSSTESKLIDARVIGFSTAAAILGATFAMAMSTSAATDDTAKPDWHGDCGAMAAQHEEVEAALERGDYATWKGLMGDRGPARFVTEENFPTFAEMHEAMEDGDYEKVQELKSELGIAMPARDVEGDGRHSRRGHGMWMHSLK